MRYLDTCAPQAPPSPAKTLPCLDHLHTPPCPSHLPKFLPRHETPETFPNRLHHSQNRLPDRPPSNQTNPTMCHTSQRAIWAFVHAVPAQRQTT